LKDDWVLQEGGEQVMAETEVKVTLVKSTESSATFEMDYPKHTGRPIEPLSFYAPFDGSLDIIYEKSPMSSKGINIRAKGKLRITVEVVKEEVSR
jgi:hypothetical protein